MADFRFPPDCEALRAEVRAFLADEVPTDLAPFSDPRDLTGLEEGFERRLQAAAGERGWLSLDPVHQALLTLAAARADAPLIDTAMTLAGAAVRRFGAAHHRSLLERMAAGEVEMCAAYTEPGAGSDLGAVAATARPEGGGWVIDGTKTLVTGAHKSDACVTIARTEPDPEVRPRDAMTMFVVALPHPGVEVRRLETMNGWSLGEIIFSGAVVGPDAVLGEVGAGWRQMAQALAAERSGMFWLGFARHVLDLLVDHVATGVVDGRPMGEDPLVLDRVGRLEAEWSAADRLARRVIWDSAGDGVEPALPSMSKVVATELLQRIAVAAVEIAGVEGLVWAPLFRGGDVPAAAGGRFAWEYLERVHGTIGSGANEVHRDAIAALATDLPRVAR